MDNQKDTRRMTDIPLFDVITDVEGNYVWLGENGITDTITVKSPNTIVSVNR